MSLSLCLLGVGCCIVFVVRGSLFVVRCIVLVRVFVSRWLFGLSFSMFLL